MNTVLFFGQYLYCTFFFINYLVYFFHHFFSFRKIFVHVKDGGEKEKKWMTTHEIFAKVARGVSSECFEKFGHKQTPAFGVLFSETKLGVKCEGSVLFRASF